VSTAVRKTERNGFYFCALQGAWRASTRRSLLFFGAKIRKVYNSKQKIGLKISVPLKKAPTHTAWVCIGVDLKSYKI
jgi:hypothetical protein